MDILKTISLSPGHYVIAVSGGVDSVTLLHMLAQIPGVELTVAHFDHGIRSDSGYDRQHVSQLARKYGLPFVYDEGKLGENASENAARKARYEFLRRVQRQAGARAIITAHHQNDVLETAAHNILRGTGRKGMSSLKSVDGIIRPLLHLPKQHLINYAKDNNLTWWEDSTNNSTRYRRNYIRHVVLPNLKQKSPEQFERLKQLVLRQQELNRAIDQSLALILHLQPDLNTLKRHDVTMLPHAVARELAGEWLRQNGKRQFGAPLLERLTISLKTARPNTFLAIDGTFRVRFDKDHARLISLKG